ncbi:hypothetical protein DTO012A7_9441 [Penicillium roqueforti]|nr:hypothetical protein LCP963914a_6155 [Penicillium roqueforti]KAI3220595.1 hypothetical protein DTO012A7_9441 [Penicillium roqueforti]
MQTPDPPDRDKREDSPPRLSRPKRTTKPPKNYTREQEIDNEQRKTRPLPKKRIKPEDQPDMATSDDSTTESDDLDISNLVQEIAKLRREIRLRDEIHKEELLKAQAEIGATLTEVRHKLQNLTDRPLTPQYHSEACSQNNHNTILREIQSLREEISIPAPTSSPSYIDIARTPPTSYPSNIRTLSTLGTTPTTFTKTLYYTIVTSKITKNKNEKISAGSIRATIEKEIRTIDDYTH